MAKLYMFPDNTNMTGGENNLKELTDSSYQIIGPIKKYLDEKNKISIKLISQMHTAIQEKIILTSNTQRKEFLELLEVYFRKFIENPEMYNNSGAFCVILYYLDEIPGVNISVDANDSLVFENDNQAISNDSLNILRILCEYFMELYAVRESIGDSITTIDIIDKIASLT